MVFECEVFVNFIEIIIVNEWVNGSMNMINLSCLCFLNLQSLLLFPRLAALGLHTTDHRNDSNL